MGDAPQRPLGARARALARELAPVWAAVLAVGLLGNLSLYGLWTTNPDGLWQDAGFVPYVFERWQVSLGRWSLYLMSLLRGGVQAPPFISAVALSLFALGAVLFARALGVRGAPARAACASAVVLSPMAGFSLSYYFSADLYGWALLTSTLAIALQLSGAWPRPARLAAGVCLFAFSFGCYQSTIGVSAGLAAAGLMLAALDPAVGARRWRAALVDCLAVGGAGAVLYVGVTRAVQAVTGVALASYGGADTISVGKILASLPQTIPGTLRAWRDFLFGHATFANNFGTPAVAAALAALGAVCFAVLLWRARRSRARVAAALAMAAVLPFASGVICIVVPGTEVKSLMAGGFVSLAALPCALACRVARGGQGTRGTLPAGAAAVPVHAAGPRAAALSPRSIARRAAVPAAVALTCALGWTYTLQMNTDAAAMHRIDSATENLANRIVADLEADPAAAPGAPALIMGSPASGNYPIDPADYPEASPYALWGLFWPSVGSTYASWENLVRYRVGTELSWASLGDYARIAASDEYAAMPSYPQEGSVAAIDGILVAKVSDMGGWS